MDRSAITWGGAISSTSAQPTKPLRPPRPLQRMRLTLVAISIALLFALYGAAVIGLLAGTVWIIGSGPLPLDSAVADFAVRAFLLAGTFSGLLLLTKGLLHFDQHFLLTEPVQPAAEPDLFELVDYVADAIHAPMPARVLIDCGSEVAIRYDGPVGFFSNRLVLQIGLSLVASLSSREFAGVLANAMAGYSAGSAPRRALFVTAANRLLSRAVAGGDAVDRALVRVSRRFAVLAPLARALLRLCDISRRESDWLRRRVAAVSEGVLQSGRQYRDDCVRFISGLSPEQLQRRVNTVRAAAVETVGRVRRNWSESREAFASLPEAVARTARTRPSPRPVAANALLACDAPASAVFTNFSRTCRRITLPCYRLQFNLPIGPEAMVAGQGAVTDSAAERLYRGGCLPLVGLGFDQGAGISDSPAPKARLYSELERKLLTALHAEALMDAGLPVEPTILGLETGIGEPLHEMCRGLEERIATVRRDLAALNAVASYRLRQAVDASGEQSARRLLAVLTRTDHLMDSLWELRQHLNILELLLTEQYRRRTVRLADRIAERRADILGLLLGFRAVLKNTPYPLEAGVYRSLERHVMIIRPDDTMSAEMVLEIGEVLLERLLTVRRTALERLAVLTTHRRQTLGLIQR